MTGSLTEWLDAEALLAAFFSFFQTESMPNTQPMILDDYCNNPTIHSQSFQSQFETLIVRPLLQLAYKSNPAFLPM